MQFLFRNIIKQYTLITVCFFLAILITTRSQAQHKKKSDSLLNVLQTTKDDTVKINTLSALSFCYANTDTTKALQYVNEGIALAKKTDYKRGLGLCYNTLGLIYKTINKFQSSLDYYQKALDIFKEVNDNIGIGKSYVLMGTIYYEQGNYYKAQEMYKQSLNVYLQINDHTGIAKSYNMMAMVFKDQGNYPKAIELNMKALKIREESGDKKGMMSSYTNIGSIHNIQCNFAKALEYFNKALMLALESNEKKGLLGSYNNIGNVYMKIAKDKTIKKDTITAKHYYDTAIVNFNKAIVILEETKDKKGMATCYNNIGFIYNGQKNYIGAISFLQKALLKFEEIDAKDEISVVCANIADLNNKTKDYNKAIQYAEKSLKIATEIGSLENQRYAYEKLSASYKAKGNFKDAMRYYELYTQLSDSIFNKEKNKQLVEMNTKYETEKKQKEIALLNKDKDLQKIQIKQQKTQIYAFIGGLMLMGFLAFVLLRSYRIKRKANIQLSIQNEEIRQQSEEIMTQRDQITEINTSLIDSIRYAERIQRAVLPSSELFNVLLDDYFVLFKPKDIVSGDFYYVAKRNNWVLFAVADCTGHGVPGAFMCMLGVSFINEIVARVDVQTAGHLLNELRDSVILSLKQKGVTGEQKDGMDITFCALNTDTLEIHYAGANNPLYIVTSKTIEDTGFQSYMQHETSDLQLVEYKPNKMPIGIYEKMDSFTNHTFQLHKGDILYLMSDGYEDQFGGPKNRKFLSKNLKKLLLSNADKPLSNQKEILDTTIEDWKNSCDLHHEQIDDITVMGVRI